MVMVLPALAGQVKATGVSPLKPGIEVSF